MRSSRTMLNSQKNMILGELKPLLKEEEELIKEDAETDEIPAFETAEANAVIHEEEDELPERNYVCFKTLKGFDAREEVGERHTPDEDLNKLKGLILKYYDDFAWDQSEITMATNFEYEIQIQDKVN